MKKPIKITLSAILSLAVGFVWFYATLPAINLRAASFWVTLALLVAVFFGAYALFGAKKPSFSSFVQDSEEKKGHKTPTLTSRFKRVLVSLVIVAVVLIATSFVTSSRVFRASDYQQMLMQAKQCGVSPYDIQQLFALIGTQRPAGL